MTRRSRATDALETIGAVIGVMLFFGGMVALFVALVALVLVTRSLL